MHLGLHPLERSGANLELCPVDLWTTEQWVPGIHLNWAGHDQIDIIRPNWKKISTGYDSTLWLLFVHISWDSMGFDFMNFADLFLSMIMNWILLVIFKKKSFEGSDWKSCSEASWSAVCTYSVQSLEIIPYFSVIYLTIIIFALWLRYYFSLWQHLIEKVTVLEIFWSCWG